MAQKHNQNWAQRPSTSSADQSTQIFESREKKGCLYEQGLIMSVFTVLTQTQEEREKIIFNIGSQVKMADKFDDVVICHPGLVESNTKIIFSHVKLVDNPQDDRIDSDVLMGIKDPPISLTKDDFNLRKYFISYLRIQNQLEQRKDNCELEKLIFFTNVKFHDSLIGTTNNGKGLLEEITSGDYAIIPKTFEDAKCYKITQADKNLKKHLNEGLKSDLENLADVFIKCINKIRNMNRSGNRQTDEILMVDLDNDDNEYIRYYHTALIDENVIEIHDKKQGNKTIRKGVFSQKFTNNDKLLSLGAKKLREKIESKTFEEKNQPYKHMRKKMKKGIPEEDLRDILKKTTFQVSKDFGTKRDREMEIFLPTYDNVMHESYIKDFLDLLQFRVGEPNRPNDFFVLIANEQIKTRFLSYWDTGDTDPKLIEFIVMDFIKNWKKPADDSQRQEVWILNTEREEFITNLLEKCSKPKAMHKTRKYVEDLKKIIQNFDLHFKSEFLFKPEDFQKPHKVFNLKTVSTLLTSIKLIKYLNERKDFIFLKLESLKKKEELSELLKTFRDDEFKLLILYYDSSLDESIQRKLVTKLSDIMKNKEKRLILLSSLVDDTLTEKFRREFYSKYTKKDDETISLEYVVDPSTILNEKITFQNQPTPLSVFVSQDDNSIKAVDAKTTEQLVTGKGRQIKVGENHLTGLGRTSNYYKDREFYRIEIKTDIQSDSNFQGKLAYTKEDFKSLCAEKRFSDVHWLTRESGKLFWQQSQGSEDSMSALRKYVEDGESRSHFYSEKELLDQSAGSVVIISNTDGMGQSTFLTNFSQSLKKSGSPCRWVIRIDLIKHTNKLDELNQRKTDIEDQAYKILLNDLLKLKEGLEKELLQCSLNDFPKNEMQVFILFDGFDEISPDYKETVIRLINGLKKTKAERLFITTRPNMRDELETKLNVLSYDLKPLSKDKDQMDFLVNFWKRKFEDENVSQVDDSKVKIYAEELIALFCETTGKLQNTEFTRIPLHLRMVAEVFYENKQRTTERDWEGCKEFSIDDTVPNRKPALPKEPSIPEFYELFVKLKFYDIHLKEKRKIDFNIPYMKEIFDRDYKIFQNKHQQ